jgi:hypothetical protein
MAASPAGIGAEIDPAAGGQCRLLDRRQRIRRQRSPGGAPRHPDGGQPATTQRRKQQTLCAGGKRGHRQDDEPRESESGLNRAQSTGPLV